MKSAFCSILWRWLVLVVFLLVVAWAFTLSGRLGGEFLPLIDDGRIMVKVKMPTGTSVSETDRVLRTIEEQIKDDPLIHSAFTLAGGYVRGLTTYEVANEGEIAIQLIPKAAREISTKEYVAQLRQVVGRHQPPGGKVMARQMPIKGIHGMQSSDLQKRQGLTSQLAVVKAASIRLRPRVMTTVTTMIGFLPLALNLEEGGDMLQPMAVAVIGGWQWRCSLPCS